MAGVKRKLEGEIEIREGAGDAFHDFFQNRPHHISGVHPEFVQGCEVHEGSFGTLGSIIFWNYYLDGKPQTLKQELVLIDEENKMMKFKCIGGDLIKEYKTFIATFQVIPKDKESSIVKWIFEYEKLDAGNRDPSTEMDALIELAKKIDDHHHHSQNK